MRRFLTAIFLSVTLFAVGNTAFGSPPPSMSRPSMSRPSSPPMGRPSPPTSLGVGNMTRPGTNGSSTSQRPAALAAPRSAASSAITRGQSASALHAFDAEQSKFKQPSIGAPQSRAQATASPVWRTYGSRWSSADQYYASRNRYIGTLPPAYHSYWTSPPPVWVVRPSYGPYSGMFLGALLGVTAGAVIDDSYASWAYAHRNDAAYMQWHQDMMAQAQNDADVQAKLAALDTKVAALQAQNAIVDPNKLPDNIDPSMVVAPETVMAATSDDSSSIGTWIISLIVVLVASGVIYAMFFRSRQSTV